MLVCVVLPCRTNLGMHASVCLLSPCRPNSCECCYCVHVTYPSMLVCVLLARTPNLGMHATVCMSIVTVYA